MMWSLCCRRQAKHKNMRKGLPWPNCGGGGSVCAVGLFRSGAIRMFAKSSEIPSDGQLVGVEVVDVWLYRFSMAWSCP